MAKIIKFPSSRETKKRPSREDIARLQQQFVVLLEERVLDRNAPRLRLSEREKYSVAVRMHDLIERAIAKADRISRTELTSRAFGGENVRVSKLFEYTQNPLKKKSRGTAKVDGYLFLAKAACEISGLDKNLEIDKLFIDASTLRKTLLGGDLSSPTPEDAEIDMSILLKRMTDYALSETDGRNFLSELCNSSAPCDSFKGGAIDPDGYETDVNVALDGGFGEYYELFPLPAVHLFTVTHEENLPVWLWQSGPVEKKYNENEYGREIEQFTTDLNEAQLAPRSALLSVRREIWLTITCNPRVDDFSPLFQQRVSINLKEADGETNIDLCIPHIVFPGVIFIGDEEEINIGFFEPQEGDYAKDNGEFGLEWKVFGPSSGFDFKAVTAQNCRRILGINTASVPVEAEFKSPLGSAEPVGTLYAPSTLGSVLEFNLYYARDEDKVSTLLINAIAEKKREYDEYRAVRRSRVNKVRGDLLKFWKEEGTNNEK